MLTNLIPFPSRRRSPRESEGPLAEGARRRLFSVSSESAIVGRETGRMCGALRKLSPAQIECARKLFPVFSNTEHGDITTAALCELEEHDGPHRGFVVPLMHAAAVWAEWTDTSTRTMLRARPDCGSRIWVDGQPDDCVLFASHPGLCTHSYASLDMTAY